MKVQFIVFNSSWESKIKSKIIETEDGLATFTRDFARKIKESDIFFFENENGNMVILPEDIMKKTIFIISKVKE